MHKNEKRPQTLQKSWIVHTARFLSLLDHCSSLCMKGLYSMMGNYLPDKSRILDCIT